MSLEEKINYEFQCFFLDQMRTSRENIFARSGEIEAKKRLLETMQMLLKDVEGPTENLLLAQSNLLESAYCFWKDVRQKKNTESIAEAVSSWLAFLNEETRHG